MYSINYKGINIELKPKMRALLYFEKIAHKSFDVSTLEDVVVYLYSTILSCSPDEEITWDDFMKELDDHPEYIMTFKDWMQNSKEFANYFLRMSDQKSPKKASKKQ